ncbi:MAG: four helix bundle protein [Proteobacteria bacterium]|nr:MAG: four helix bundle protein [Pseudomonadota bacterium]
MKNLDGINVWNRSCNMAIRTHKALGPCPDPNFRERITRASLAVASNIAAGYERNSTWQFRQYLNKANGSCAELRTQLYIAAELGIIDHAQSTNLIAETLEISTLLRSLITSTI